MRTATVLFLLLLVPVTGCSSTLGDREPADENGDITIQGDELEPMVNFLLETRRVIAADYVRVEASTQFFEQKMGLTRDLRYVDRSDTRLPDGTRVIALRNTNTDQRTNRDPDLLPRVYFGNGLEIRAYAEIRIHFRRAKEKERPLFLDVRARNSSGDVKMWVTGRLQHQQPALNLSSALIWSEDKERFLHRQSIG